jgi:hypothetical protein
MKISRVMIAVIAMPVALAAQTPGAPPAGPQADPITTVLRGRTMNLQRNLAQAFDSIPASLFGYKPTPKQLTIGYIAQHLANDNYFFCSNFGAMKPNRPAADTATADSIKATWPKETLNAKLKESFKFCEDAFAQLNDKSLAENVGVPGPNGTTRQVPRAAAVVGHVIDIADHYSQIANYMRLNNLIPPSALPRPPRAQ